MSMKEWAENEIRLAREKERSTTKNYDEWDYGCACYESALKAFKTLLEDDHSGMSINITKSILNRLIDGNPLTPINDTDDVWNDICDRSGLHGEIASYQCKRMSSLFKYVYANGDIKYHDINRIVCADINHPTLTYYNGLISNIIDEMYPITMPYMPSNIFKVYTEDFLFDINNGDFDTLAVLHMVKAEGDTQPINRYFKEEDHQWVEITEIEYLDRKNNAVRRDNINE